LDRTVACLRTYQALLERLRDDLIARRRTLAEAAETLAGSGWVQDSNWLQRVGERYPNCTKNECLAAHLMNHTLRFEALDADTVARLARELDLQYRASFGRPAPSPVGGYGVEAAFGPG
jgi:hypothetical protein